MTQKPLISNRQIRRPSIIDILKAFVSWEFFVSLMVLFSLSLFIHIILFKRELWIILDRVSFRFIVITLFLNRTGAFIYGLRKGDKSTILSLGIMVLITGTVINYLYRFNGTVYIAEDEPFSGYSYRQKGLLRDEKIHSISFRNGVAKIDGISLTSSKRKSMNLFRGSYFILKDTHLAPGFIITSGNRELYSVIVKMDLSDKRRDYFRTPVLPHRFYLENKGENGLFRIIITRGKLIILDKEIMYGDTVEFENIRLSFSELIRWAEINVEHYPGDPFIYSGLFLLLFGLLVFIKGYCNILLH